MSTDAVVADRPERQCYEVSVDGHVVGRADYVRRGDRVVMPHTQVDPAHGGRGLGGRMVRYALDDIRARGLHVEPACPFVAHYIAKHPEYADLL